MPGSDTLARDAVLPDADALIREARRRQRRRWVAGFALLALVTIMLTAVVIFGVRNAPDKHGSALASTARRSVTPVGVPPASGFLSTPYAPARLGGRAHAVTLWNWNGHRATIVHTGPVVDCCSTVSLSPDGTRLQVFSGTGAEIVDRRGRVLVQSSHLAGTWADDSRHRCTFQPHTKAENADNGATDLVIIDPDGQRRVVAAVGYNASHGGPGILRCSVDSNQALVVESSMTFVTDVWQVDLNTGRVTTPSWLPPIRTVSGIAVSANGRFAAVHLWGSGPQETTVINTQTGKPIAHVSGSPVAMSWEGHLIVVDRELALAVVDWRTGTTVWHSPPSRTSPADAAIAPREHSDDLALAVRSEPGQAYRQAALWLIRPHTPPRLLDPNVLFGII